MSLPYREFSSYVLGDLAVRAEQQEHIDRITFYGNHVSRQFVKPRKEDFETSEAFALSMKEFRKRLPRHSDQSYRLALAFEAFTRAGEKDESAADLIWEEMKRAPARSAKEQERWAEVGIQIPHKPTQFNIGATRRGRRTKRRRRVISPIDPNPCVATIRVQASRYISEHMDFEHRFNTEFGAFRSRFYRDAEWYAEQEHECKLEIARLQEYLAAAQSGQVPRAPWAMPVAEWEHLKAANMCPTAADVAMRVVNLALLYHEQGKYSDAETCYYRAVELYRSVSVARQLQQVVLPWIGAQIANCGKSCGPDPSPSIDRREKPAACATPVTVSPGVPGPTDASAS